MFFNHSKDSKLIELALFSLKIIILFLTVRGLRKANAVIVNDGHKIIKAIVFLIKMTLIYTSINKKLNISILNPLDLILGP